MKKLTLSLITIATTIATLTLTSCGGGGGDDDTIDNSHMFGTFKGVMTITQEDTRETSSDKFYMVVGADYNRVEETSYIYLSTNSDEMYYSGQENINGYETTYIYEADTTINTITWSKEFTEAGESFTIQGTMTFNNDFNSGSANGTMLSNNNYSVEFECTDFNRE